MPANKRSATKKSATKTTSRAVGMAKKAPAQKAAKKPAAKKAAAKKPVAKKPVAKKAVAKKPVARKAVAKSSTPKTSVKKAAASKLTAEKKRVVSRVKSRAKALKVSPEPAVPVAKHKTADKMKKLSKKEKNDFTSMLLAQRERLVQQVDSLKDASLRGSEDIVTEEDGTDAFERQFALTLASSELEAVHDIDDALRRLHEGTYGICEECGCGVERRRLSALPFVRLCITCQSERERNQRLFRPVM